MARVILLVGFLFTQTLLISTLSWNIKKRLICQSFSGSPLRTTFKSALSGPIFLSAKPLLTAFPKAEDAPVKPSTDEIYISEPIKVNEKTEVILHKFHKFIQDILNEEEENFEAVGDTTLESENSDEEYTESEESRSVIDHRTDSEEVTDKDDVIPNNKSNKESIESIELENSYEDNCSDPDEIDADNSDVDNIIKIDINIC